MNQKGGLACCAVCNEQTNRRCGRCLNIYYCNTEHQRQDWRRHKSECAPKLPKQSSRKDKTSSSSHANAGEESAKNVEQRNLAAGDGGEKEIKAGSSRHSKKSKKKEVNEVNTISKQSSDASAVSTENVKQTEGASTSGSPSSSVISSVVYTNKDLTSECAITYEGSSEQEILSESAQQLSSVDFAVPSTSSNVLKAVNRTNMKMPVLPELPTKAKEYPEAIIKSTGALFGQLPSSLHMDPSDPYYEICQRVIRDMTQYGVCVLDNFHGRERGLLVRNEVLQMYTSGIFTAGQVVSNPGGREARTVRSDRITWIDGTEPHCFYIRQLISHVDHIVLKANKMANNGKMGDYNINGRTKAMVACYPGSGSHYVKHVDNPNKDGRCITAIYYLNLDWDVRRCGGLLRVFPEGTNQVADIAPIFDRMLFFWSDRRNPHEVQPAYSTRYAITLWYFDSQERAEARRQFAERGQPSSSK